jgi:hypothetical protein
LADLKSHPEPHIGGKSTLSRLALSAALYAVRRIRGLSCVQSASFKAWTAYVVSYVLTF